MDIGVRFKQLRVTNNLKQVEFAQRVGISQSTLSEIEKGRSNPSVETVISTSKYFKVSTDWLLKGEL
jgi:transcriptional regulator with XRE-family HTH domain